MIGKKIQALNGLRGIAALIVVVSHFSNETGLFGGLLGWGGGQTGVMLFFILAGFLMAHLHINEVFNRSNVGHYAIKRIARVYPFFVLVAAIPSLLLYLGFPGKVAMGDVNSLSVYLRQILLIDKGVNVFWTIQIEIFFYVFFVGIWGLHWLLGKPYTTLLLVLGAILLLWLQGFNFKTPFFGLVHYFLIGIASALTVTASGGRECSSKWLSCVGLALLASLPVTFPRVFSVLFGGSIDPWKSLLVLAQIAILFNIAVRDAGILKVVLSSKPLVWVGKVSYSIYLLHYFILDALVSWSTPSDNYILSFAIFISVVFVVAAISYRFVERPIQRFVLKFPEVVNRWIGSRGVTSNKF